MNHVSVARLGWHFDFHTPRYVRVNRKPETKALAKSLKSAGVEEVITFAKCHFGFSYYPTRVATPHPRMKGDAFGNVLKACRGEGLRVLAYISFGIDGQAGERHPEWRQLDKDGKDLRSQDFICVCPFTGYLEKLMLPQVAEVVQGYRPDGFWFDTMSALAPCYCKCCRQSFRKATGKDIPEDEKSSLQAVFGKWRHDRGVAMVERVAGLIHQQLPGATVAFNQLGSLSYPEPMPKGVTVLSFDPPTFGPQSIQFSLNAAFGAATGQPCDVMPTIFNQGWGDWSLATHLRLEQVAVAVWARGARLFYGDRLHPENRLTEITRRALKVVGALRKRVRAEFPSPDAAPVPEVLIVHSPSVTYGEEYEQFAMDPRSRLGRISGAQTLSLDCGLNHTVAAESALPLWLHKVRLVILPELNTLTREAAAGLRRFVQNGGRLLITGRLPKVDGREISWVGARQEDKPWQDHVYLPAWPGSDGLPVLVRGDFRKVQLRGARSLLSAIPAYDARHGKRYGWGIGPACDKPSPYPLLTSHRLGRGRVWHLAAPIFQDYAAHANWQQRTWFQQLALTINSTYRAWLESPTGKVELVLWENSTSTWAILIQHGGEQLCGTVGSPLPWMRTIGPIPRENLILHLRRESGNVARVSSANRAIRWKKRGNLVSIPVRLTSIWQVVRVDWSESIRNSC